MSEAKAVALQYEANKSPTILATGTGEAAEEMVALAKELAIPLMENEELAALLAASEQNDPMPDWLESAVTDILAFALWLQGKAPNPMYPGEKDITDQ